MIDGDKKILKGKSAELAAKKAKEKDIKYYKEYLKQKKEKADKPKKLKKPDSINEIKSVEEQTQSIYNFIYNDIDKYEKESEVQNDLLIKAASKGIDYSNLKYNDIEQQGNLGKLFGSTFYTGLKQFIGAIPEYRLKETLPGLEVVPKLTGELAKFAADYVPSESLSKELKTFGMLNVKASKAYNKLGLDPLKYIYGIIDKTVMMGLDNFLTHDSFDYPDSFVGELGRVFNAYTPSENNKLNDFYVNASKEFALAQSKYGAYINYNPINNEVWKDPNSTQWDKLVKGINWNGLLKDPKGRRYFISQLTGGFASSLPQMVIMMASGAGLSSIGISGKGAELGLSILGSMGEGSQMGYEIYANTIGSYVKKHFANKGGEKGFSLAEATKLKELYDEAIKDGYSPERAQAIATYKLGGWYNEVLKTFPEEERKYIQAQANKAYNGTISMNLATILTEYIPASAIVKGFKRPSKKILKKFVSQFEKNAIKSAEKESTVIFKGVTRNRLNKVYFLTGEAFASIGSEYIEERILNKSAENYGTKIGMGYEDFGVSDYLAAFNDPSAEFEGIIGAISGFATTASINAITFRNRRNFYRKQREAVEIIEKIGKTLKYNDILAVASSSKEMNELFEKIKNEEDPDKRAELASSILFNQMELAFRTGTTEHLINMYKEMADKDDENRISILNVISLIEKVEQHYANAVGKKMLNISDILAIAYDLESFNFARNEVISKLNELSNFDNIEQNHKESETQSEEYNNTVKIKKEVDKEISKYQKLLNKATSDKTQEMLGNEQALIKEAIESDIFSIPSKKEYDKKVNELLKKYGITKKKRAEIVRGSLQVNRNYFLKRKGDYLNSIFKGKKIKKSRKQLKDLILSIDKEISSTTKKMTDKDLNLLSSQILNYINERGETSIQQFIQDLIVNGNNIDRLMLESVSNNFDDIVKAWEKSTFSKISKKDKAILQSRLLLLKQQFNTDTKTTKEEEVKKEVKEEVKEEKKTKEEGSEFGKFAENYGHVKMDDESEDGIFIPLLIKTEFVNGIYRVVNKIGKIFNATRALLPDRFNKGYVFQANVGDNVFYFQDKKSNYWAKSFNAYLNKKFKIRMSPNSKGSTTVINNDGVVTFKQGTSDYIEYKEVKNTNFIGINKVLLIKEDSDYELVTKDVDNAKLYEINYNDNTAKIVVEKKDGTKIEKTIEIYNDFAYSRLINLHDNDGTKIATLPNPLSYMFDGNVKNPRRLQKENLKIRYKIGTQGNAKLKVVSRKVFNLRKSHSLGTISERLPDSKMGVVVQGLIYLNGKPFEIKSKNKTVKIINDFDTASLNDGTPIALVKVNTHDNIDEYYAYPVMSTTTISKEIADNIKVIFKAITGLYNKEKTDMIISSIKDNLNYDINTQSGLIKYLKSFIKLAPPAQLRNIKDDNKLDIALTEYLKKSSVPAIMFYHKNSIVLAVKDGDNVTIARLKKSESQNTTFLNLVEKFADELTIGFSSEVTNKNIPIFNSRIIENEEVVIKEEVNGEKMYKDMLQTMYTHLLTQDDKITYAENLILKVSLASDSENLSGGKVMVSETEDKELFERGKKPENQAVSDGIVLASKLLAGLELITIDSDEDNISLIKGLSGLGQTQLIKHLVSQVFNNIENPTKEDFVNLLSEIQNAKKKYEDGITAIENAILISNDENTKASLKEKLESIKDKMFIFDNIINNWDLLSDKILLMYVQYTNTDLEELDKENPEDQVFDKSNAEKLLHQSISTELKKFFGSIKKLDENGNEIPGIFGFPTYVNFKETLNTILTLIVSEENPTLTYEDVIKILTEHSSNKYWVKEFIKKLGDADEQIKNKFMSFVQKHNMTMKILVVKNDKKNGFTMSLFNTNSNKLINDIKDEWESGINISNVVTSTNNGIVVSIPAVKKLREKFNELRNKYQDNTNLTLDELKEIQQWLGEFGIPLSLDALKEMNTNGLVVGRVYMSWKSLFNDKGKNRAFFGGLMKAFETPEYQNISIKSPLEAISNTVKAVIKLESRFNERTPSVTFMSGDKMLSGIVNNSFASDRVSALKNDKKLLTELLLDPFSSESMLLQLLNDDESMVNELFYLEHVGLIPMKVNKKESVSFAQLSPADKILFVTGLFQNMVNSKLNETFMNIPLRMSNILFPAISDKEQGLMLNMPVLDLNNNHIKIKDGKIYFSDNLKKVLFTQLVLPELKRIRSSNTKDVEGLSIASKMFIMFPELNNIKIGDKSILEKLETEQDYDAENDLNFYNAAISVITQAIVDEYEITMNDWNNANLIENGKLKNINKPYAKKFTSDHLEMSILDFVINDFIAKANMHYSIIGDIAAYFTDKNFNDFGVDYSKIDSKYHNLGSYGDIMSQVEIDYANNEITKEEYDYIKKNLKPLLYLPQSNDSYSSVVQKMLFNYNKRMALVLAPGIRLANTKNEKFAIFMVEDVPEIADNILYLIELYYSKDSVEKAKKIIDSINDKNKKIKIRELQNEFPELSDFFEIESTDGQEYTTVLEHLTFLFNNGKISKKKFDDLLDKYNKEEDFTPKELKEIIFQPIKPVTTGFVKDINDDSKRMIYVKSSSFPLIPQITRNFKIDKVRQKLEALEKELGHPVRLAHKSAAKVGFKNNGVTYDDLYGDKDVTEEMKYSVVISSRENLKLQQDVPVHSEYTIEDMQTLGSQLIKLLFGDGIIDETFVYDGQEIDGKTLLSLMENQFGELIKIFKNELFDELGLGKNGEIKNQREFISNISELIKREALARNYPEKVLNELEITVKKEDGIDIVMFSSPLWLSSSSVRFESLLNSIIRNKLLRMKLPGYSYVVGSQNGFTIVNDISELPKEIVNDIIFTSKWNGNKLTPLKFTFGQESTTNNKAEEQNKTVNFSVKNIFTVNPIKSVDKKAESKAKIATKYIGFADGIPGSSTALYAKQAGEYANTGNYNKDDVVFVSIGGKRGNIKTRTEQQDKTINEAIKALEAGTTILTDNKEYTDKSTYNEGEKRLKSELEKRGYDYFETVVDGNKIGVWRKNENINEEAKKTPPNTQNFQGITKQQTITNELSNNNNISSEKEINGIKNGSTYNGVNIIINNSQSQPLVSYPDDNEIVISRLILNNIFRNNMFEDIGISNNTIRTFKLNKSYANFEKYIIELGYSALNNPDFTLQELSEHASLTLSLKDNNVTDYEYITPENASNDDLKELTSLGIFKIGDVFVISIDDKIDANIRKGFHFRNKGYVLKDIYEGYKTKSNEKTKITLKSIGEKNSLIIEFYDNDIYEENGIKLINHKITKTLVVPILPVKSDQIKDLKIDNAASEQIKLRGFKIKNVSRKKAESFFNLRMKVSIANELNRMLKLNISIKDLDNLTDDEIIDLFKKIKINAINDIIGYFNRIISNKSKEDIISSILGSVVKRVGKDINNEELSKIRKILEILPEEFLKLIPISYVANSGALYNDDNVRRMFSNIINDLQSTFISHSELWKTLSVNVILREFVDNGQLDKKVIDNLNEQLKDEIKSLILLELKNSFILGNRFNINNLTKKIISKRRDIITSFFRDNDMIISYENMLSDKPEITKLLKEIKEILSYHNYINISQKIFFSKFGTYLPDYVLSHEIGHTYDNHMRTMYPNESEKIHNFISKLLSKKEFSNYLASSLFVRGYSIEDKDEIAADIFAYIILKKAGIKIEDPKIKSLEDFFDDNKRLIEDVFNETFGEHDTIKSFDDLAKFLLKKFVEFVNKLFGSEVINENLGLTTESLKIVKYLNKVVENQELFKPKSIVEKIALNSVDKPQTNQRQNFGIEKKSNIKPAQVFLKSLFRDNSGNLINLMEGEGDNRKYIFKKDGKWFLKEDMIPEELLSLINFRIPSSFLASGSLVEVAGFLPPYAGDLMIIPKEFQVTKGLDYDVDKENTYHLATIVKDGKIIPADKTGLSEEELDEYIRIVGNEVKRVKRQVGINSSMDKHIKMAEQTNDILEEFGLGELVDFDEIEFYKNQKVDPLSKEEVTELINYYKRLKKLKKLIHYNKIIRIHDSVYRSDNKNVQQKINSVLSMDHAKGQASMIEDAMIKNNKFVSILSSSYQLNQVTLGAVGKMGIGVYSVAVTFNALAQQNKEELYVTNDDNERISFKMGDTVSNGSFGRYVSLLPSKSLNILKTILSDSFYTKVVNGKYNVKELNDKIVAKIDEIEFSDIISLFNNPAIQDGIKSGKSQTEIINDIKSGKIKINIRSISNILGERQNTATDNAKVGIMGKTNINSNTIGAEVAMILLGFDISEVIVNKNGKYKESSLSYLLMSSPAIRELTNTLSTSMLNNEFKNKTDVIASLIEKYGGEKKVDLSLLTAQNLYDAISGKITGEKLNQINLASIIAFRNFDNISADLMIINSIFSTGTKGFGTTFSDANIKYENVIKTIMGLNIKNAISLFGKVYNTNSVHNRSSLIQQGYIDFDGLMIKPTTVMGHILLSGISINKHLWDNVWIHNTSKFKSIFNQILLNSKYKDSKNVSKISSFRTSVVNELKKMVNTYVAKIVFNINDVVLEREKLFKYTKNGEPLAAYLLKLKTNGNEIFNTNEFLLNLKFEVSKDKNSISRIIFNNIDADIESSYFENEIKKLYFNERKIGIGYNGNQEYTTKNLVIDLAKYLLLSGGEFSAISPIKVFPFEVLEDMGINAELRKFTPSILSDEFSINMSLATTLWKNESKGFPGEFLVQFFQHFPNEAYSVDRKDIRVKGILTQFSINDVNTEEDLPPNIISVYDKGDISLFLFSAEDGKYHKIPVTKDYLFSQYNPSRPMLFIITGNNPVIDPKLFINVGSNESSNVSDEEDNIPNDDTTEFQKLAKENNLGELINKILKSDNVSNEIKSILTSLLSNKHSKNIIKTFDIVSANIGNDYGSFDYSNNLVSISSAINSEQMFASALAHELLHGVTTTELNIIGGSTVKPESYKRLNYIFNVLKSKNVPDEFKNMAFEDIYEFVVYVIENKEFRDWVDYVSLTDEEKSKIGIRKTLSKKIELLFNSLMKAIGITLNNFRLSANIIELTADIIDRATKLESDINTLRYDQYTEIADMKLEPDKYNYSTIVDSETGEFRFIEFDIPFAKRFKMYVGVQDNKIVLGKRYAFGNEDIVALSQNEIDKIVENYGSIENYLRENIGSEATNKILSIVKTNNEVNGKIIDINKILDSYTGAVDIDGEPKLKEKYKGKIILSQYGIGKTYASKLNSRIIDSDEIIKKVLFEYYNNKTPGVYKNWKEINIVKGIIDADSKIYDDIASIFNELAKRGYTVLTPNLKVSEIINVDNIIYTKKYNLLSNRVATREEGQFTISEDKLEEMTNKILENKAESINIEDKYISDELFENSSVARTSDIVLYEEQVSAMNKVTEWVRKLISSYKSNKNVDPLKEGMFFISGPAGSGKTFTLGHILTSIFGSKEIGIYLAPTHKAKAILQRSVGKDVNTLQSFLGIRPLSGTNDIFIGATLEQLKQSVYMEDNIPPILQIGTRPVIIIDEASQLGFNPLPKPEMFRFYDEVNRRWAEIEAYKNPDLGTYLLEIIKSFNIKPIVILVGDIAQTVPVNTDKEKVSELLTSIIDSGNFSMLEEVRRTNDKNIFDIGNTVREFFYHIFNTPINKRSGIKNALVNILSNDDYYNGKTLIKLNNTMQMIDEFIKEYKKATDNPDHTVIINYNNAKHPNTVKMVDVIRKKLFGDDIKEFNENELVTISSLIKYKSNTKTRELPLNNKEYYNSASESTDEIPVNLQAIIKNVSFRKRSVTIKVGRNTYTYDNIPVYSFDLQYINPKDGKLEVIKNFEYISNEWIKNQWSMEQSQRDVPNKQHLFLLGEMNGKLDYGYIVNNYKIQGSSINVTFVDANNILNSRASLLHKTTFMYTALTRAVDKMYINITKRPTATTTIATAKPIDTGTIDIGAKGNIFSNFGNINNC